MKWKINKLSSVVELQNPGVVSTNWNTAVAAEMKALWEFWAILKDVAHIVWIDD